ncbi:ABC transporter ATP-binding protein [Paenibacillus sambharensis]|uniref:ABC transporter ATP-binding protein n=1 Tax=Paenibacillus sambharensis TaxID=1803190 RepID=A0A2W1L3S9_9BACL|nr:ATP-binding cassette domain-containing protein [Paenibacillus sambharensis]PZD94006.1 ABC transporter ATP-binding protein [Paenibacillus sambharensis]
MQIQIEQISKQYNRKSYALQNITLDIGQGVCGLLGRNGAGKTTLMRILTGILEASSGSVSVDGMLMTPKNRTRLQSLIGYLPQEVGFYPNLTVRETMDYIAILHGVNGRSRRAGIRAALENVNLDRHAEKKVRELSGGMRRRLGIAQAIIHEPELLIVDEPTTGVDPEERISIRNLLAEYAGRRTVILSTHIIEDIAQSSRQVAVLDRGLLKYQGDLGSMIREAAGVVWECRLPLGEDYRSLLPEYMLVASHYMEDGIKLRVLGSKQPPVESTQVPPTAEDAYIWMIGGLAQ